MVVIDWTVIGRKEMAYLVIAGNSERANVYLVHVIAQEAKAFISEL